ncbi:MAG TPA: hypothetical protein VFV38_40875 [Ktedonobacteraceae bacterium]|nr:hypothetical protein [Ktedonobacteraceae bacterium]
MLQQNASIALALHGQMLATWHSLSDGLFYPALAGWLGPDDRGAELVYLVPRAGQLVGFSTWQEARDVAAAAQRVEGTPLLRLEQGAFPLHARRQALQAKSEGV